MRPDVPCRGCECRTADCHADCESYMIFKYVQANYLQDLQKARQAERDLSVTRKHSKSSVKKKGAARRKG